jgi:hypothetical protein
MTQSSIWQRYISTDYSACQSNFYIFKKIVAAGIFPYCRSFELIRFSPYNQGFALYAQKKT